MPITNLADLRMHLRLIESQAIAASAAAERGATDPESAVAAMAFISAMLTSLATDAALAIDALDGFEDVAE